MKKLLSFFAVIVLMALSVSSASAATHGPRIILKNGTSTNWSGYASVLGSLTSPTNGVVSDVKGTWTVPAVDCSLAATNTYSSAWVGIDGYTSSSVEQLGTEHDCISGQPQYYAWYEMYPKPGYRITKLSVQPGDVMTGEVQYTGNGSFVLTLSSSRGAFKTTQKSNKAVRSSAEWIVEAPWSGGVLPLANFGTVPFSSTSATINGVPGTINAFTYDKINMANASNVLKDQTSDLSSGGTAFSVTWKSSN